MTYEKISRGLDDDTIEARRRTMLNVKTDDITSAPSTNWIDRLLDRHNAGEILLQTQIEMLKRAGKL